MSIEEELNPTKQKKNWLKSKVLWSVVGTIIIILISSSIGYSSGYSAAKVKLDGKMSSYNDLVKKIGTSNNDLNSINNDIQSEQSKLNGITTKLNANQDKFNQLQDLENNKDKLSSQLTDLKSKLSSTQNDISISQSKLSNLNDQIKSASGQLEQDKGAPKTLGAGNFTVGKDIPSGRYKVTPIGSGNFVVYDSSGDIKVNTILGDGDLGVSSYVFEADSGDQIDNEASFKFTPIK